MLWKYLLPLLKNMVTNRQDVVQKQVDDSAEAERLNAEAKQRYDERASHRRPENLTRQELIGLVRGLLDVLYLNDSEDGKSFLDTDKQWSADTIQEVADVLDAYGLIPG